MNQDTYHSLTIAIDAGEAAKARLVKRFEAIIAVAHTHFKSRKAEYEAVFPLVHGWQYARPSGLFGMKGHYHEHNIAAGGVIYLTFEYACGDGNEYLNCQFPESLIWATDAELTAYLTAEFDRVIAAKLAADKAKADEQAAKQRAEYERLKAQFEGKTS